MKKNFKSLGLTVVFFFIIAVSFFCLNPNIANAESQFKVGQKYSGLIQLQKNGRSMQIPLPQGEWVVSGLEEKQSPTSKSNMVKVYLFNFDKIRKIVKGVIVFWFPNENFSLGWAADKWCNRKNHLYKKVKNNYASTNIDCWGVHFARMTSSKYQAAIDSLAYAHSNGYKVPINTVFARFKKVEYAETLQISYYFNPEVEGISSPEYSDTNNSDYHPTRIGQYPDKKKYVDKIVDWAKNWNKFVDLGFEGKLTASQMSSGK
ncbi:MAG: hypothetical protein OEY85_00915 [Rhodospirillales bacterium]|nr:hypothetical protein [Rhodospirillales bacterium]